MPSVGLERQDEPGDERVDEQGEHERDRRRDEEKGRVESPPPSRGCRRGVDRPAPSGGGAPPTPGGETQSPPGRRGPANGVPPAPRAVRCASECVSPRGAP